MLGIAGTVEEVKGGIFECHSVGHSGRKEWVAWMFEVLVLTRFGQFAEPTNMDLAIRV